MGNVLIVDDEGKLRALLAMALDSQGHSIHEAESTEQALTQLPSLMPEVVITDLRMEGKPGLELLQTIKKEYPLIEVIVMTAFADGKTGIEAMRLGALEYVAKPFEMEEMLLLVERALEKHNLGKEVTSLRKKTETNLSLDSLTGQSPKMRHAIAQAKIVAQRDTTILIRGKSGTGKELFARGIHWESNRKTFLPINCGALPENLLESELFGHEKGSFTGATTRKIGLFEKANEGTIFLDEIGDISPALQLKLLRVLQEREFSRVGGTAIITTSARVIAATNRNLEEAVSEGDFREDLYYRLNVFPLMLPALSERKDDIPDLVDRFCLKYKHFQGIAPQVLDTLKLYAWPGNVRELENCIERSTIIAGGETILATHLPEHIQQCKTPYASASVQLPDEGISLDELEKSLILQALQKADGNKSQAAKLLGISRRAMYSKMKTHGIEGL